MMPKNYSDHTILLACLKKHDLNAFDYLYNSTRNRLLILAAVIVKDEEVARDLVQDFFLDFWENKHYAGIQDSLPYYLTRAIRNRAINYNKKQAVAHRWADRRSGPDEIGQTNLLENKELKGELESAIQSLPPMAGNVFRLHYMEQLSHAEISEKLGISKSTVSSHIDRALKELRAKFRER